MPQFDGAATQRLLPYPALTVALRQIFLDKVANRVVAPPRLIMPLVDGGTLLVMPAANAALAITKLVTVHRDNHKLGLPSIQAEVTVMDARNGTRLFVLDGATVTARRTAALSALAAQTLAPGNTGPLLIVGAGVQGRAHLEAFHAVLGVREVFIASRTAARAQALAAHAAAMGLQAQVIADANTVLPHVRLIATGTTSSTPVLQNGDGVRADAFVAAVGAYNHHMAELPPSLVQRAHVCVDSLEGARVEAGDLLQANVNWEAVVPLERVIAGGMAPNRFGAAPIVFKSVGHALWDLAAANLAREQMGRE